MAQSANVETTHGFLRALERRDATPIAELVTDDVSLLLPFGASGGLEPAARLDGRWAVTQVQQVAVDTFSEVRFTNPRTTASLDGQTVFVESVGRRVQRSTERVYDNVYVFEFEFRDGRICAITEYSNPVAFATFFDRPLG